MTTPAPDHTKAVRALKKADPVLAELIRKIGPCTMEIGGAQSIFQSISRAIVYQQLSGKAAATIHGRVCALFPKSSRGLRPESILAASDEALRGAGLSRAKTAALQDLARKCTDGEVPTLAAARKMSDDDLIESLVQVRGVGRWTVEMFLMFRLGRPDILPADDYGVRKGFAVTYRKRDLPSRKDLLSYGECWAPWRSVASWYLWRAADQATAAGTKTKGAKAS